jgi:hypothetical protein
MWPNVQVVPGGEGLHAVDVLLHYVGQHDRRGGVNTVEETLECSLNAVHAVLLMILSMNDRGAAVLAFLEC